MLKPVRFKVLKSMLAKLILSRRTVVLFKSSTLIVVAVITLLPKSIALKTVCSNNLTESFVLIYRSKTFLANGIVSLRLSLMEF